MKTEKSIDVLNKLVEINNDRTEGYKTALKEAHEAELKKMFTRFITTSQKCKTELDDEILTLGGKPTEGTKTTGKLYRMWMDTKAAFTSHDREAILNSCEAGEDVAVSTYKDVLKNDLADLTPAQKAMVTKQASMIKADHDTVKKMRDMAKVEHR